MWLIVSATDHNKKNTGHILFTKMHCEYRIYIPICTIYKTSRGALSAYKHVLDADEERTASFINDFKNDQHYELIDEEILKIHEV